MGLLQLSHQKETKNLEKKRRNTRVNNYIKLNFVNGAAPALNADNLNHMDDGIAAATEGVTAVETALATKAEKTDVDAALATKAEKTDVDAALATKADKATTLDGYGITDAYTKNVVNACLNKKADNAKSLAGYGITDAYTKTETDTALAEKEDLSNKISDNQSVTEDNAADLYPSVKYLQDYYYTFNDVYSQDEADILLAEKSDKSTTLAGYGITDAYTKTEADTALEAKADTETGSGTLSPSSDAYSGSTGAFIYSKAGNTVTVTLSMTAFTSGASSVIMSGLPFAAKSTYKLMSSVAQTSSYINCNLRIDRANLYIRKTSGTFADGETLTTTITYITT